MPRVISMQEVKIMISMICKSLKPLLTSYIFFLRKMQYDVHSFPYQNHMCAKLKKTTKHNSHSSGMSSLSSHHNNHTHK